MSKYDHLKILKPTKARTWHVCAKCSADIDVAEIYYREHIEDLFLHTLHSKKYCSSCYRQLGDALLGRR